MGDVEDAVMATVTDGSTMVSGPLVKAVTNPAGISV